MDNLEKILDLLQKEKLTADESDYLNNLNNNDLEGLKLYNDYFKIEKAVKSSSHLSVDELGEYILFKNGTEGDDKSIIKQAPKIEAHLRECKKCTEEFKLLNGEYSETENFLSNEFAKKSPEENKTQQVPAAITRRLYTSRYGFATTIILGFLILSAIVVSNLTSPSFYKLAKVSNGSEFSNSRGRATNYFQEGLKSLEENNSDQAIKFFNEDIKQNSSDETIFYSYYIIGLTYLQESENSFLGLFPSYNKPKVVEGINNLQACIQKNNSGKFPDINMDADFYLAKASLMLEDKQEAIKYLKIVVDGKGSRMNNAAEILKELE